MLLLFAQTNESIFEAYVIHSPQPEDIVAAAKIIVADRGKMVYDRFTHKLLVYAPRKEHALIAELLQKTLPTGINIQIDVTINEMEDSSVSKGSISGSVTHTKDTRKNSKSDIQINPALNVRSIVKTGRTTQSLVVSDGSAAIIEIGTEVPFSEWLIKFGRQHGYIQQNVRYKHTGASLRILPRIIDEEKGLIAIKLIPELSAVNEEENNFATIQFLNVSTELILHDGETIIFGGAINNKEFYDKFLVGFTKEGIKKRIQMVLTPRLIKTKK